MQPTHKESEYARLRRELEAAYAAPVWNSRLIDRIANAIARLERASMRRLAHGEYMLPANSSPMRSLDMSSAA